MALAGPAFCQSSHDADPAAKTLPAPAVPRLDPHPVVALTFDDLPGPGALPPGATRVKVLGRLASELKAAHMRGTWGFVNGNKVMRGADDQAALRNWVAAGMNIGSHTWSHMPLSSNTAEAFEQDIASNEPILTQYAAGRDWHWFRYPFLWEGDTAEKRRAVRSWLEEHGYRIASVSLDFEDYAWNDAYARCKARHDDTSIAWLRSSYLETAAAYITLGREEEHLAMGHEFPNILLLHANAFTTLMLPDLLKQLRSEGFTFSTLEKVTADPAWSLDPDAGLRYGGTLPDQFMDSRHLKYPPFPPKPFDRLKAVCQ